MKPQLEARARAQQIPIKRIDIVNWKSDVARQYKINRLPTVWMYKDGKLINQNSQEVLKQIMT